MTLLLLLLGACGRTGEVRGTLTSADDHLPIGGAPVLALAPGARGDCARRSATADADGGFTIPGLCAQDRYHLVSGDPSWWVVEPVEVTAAEARTGVDLEARRIPPTEGAWLRRGRELLPIEAGTRFDAVTFGDRALRVPIAMPATPPAINSAAQLVLVGAAAVDARLARLEPDAGGGLPGWYTLALDADHPDAPTAAVPDPGSVLDLSGPAPPDPSPTLGAADATRRARVLSDGALPPGWYALVPPANADGTTPAAWVVTFGATPSGG